MTTEAQLEQQERSQVLRNDQRVREQASTFLQQTHIDDAGGRFSAVNAASVVGADPIPKYPAASAPFQIDPVPNEEPLGYEIHSLGPDYSLSQGHAPTEATTGQGVEHAVGAHSLGPPPSTAQAPGPTSATPSDVGPLSSRRSYRRY